MGCITIEEPEFRKPQYLIRPVCKPVKAWIDRNIIFIILDRKQICPQLRKEKLISLPQCSLYNYPWGKEVGNKI